MSKASDESAAEKVTYIARVVGVHKDTDLAVLKIEATGLPYLPIDPKHPIHQGEIVLALREPRNGRLV